MGSEKIPGHIPGESEEADRGQARGRGSGGGREAKETGARRGFDGCVEAEPGADGREEETGGDGELRGAGGGSGGRQAAATAIGLFLQISALVFVGPSNLDSDLCIPAWVANDFQ